ncbi:MAG TPA: acyl-CoA dehydrogenase [Hyphomicrobiaceae bacterium]|nr:acyl-CoA dehydrogenase [Hyphomicrobiaceae bacterium]
MTKLISRRHLSFILDEVIDVARLCRLPRFAEHDRASFSASLDMAEALAIEELLPSYALLDREEPRLVAGRVVLPAATARSINAMRALGLFGMYAAPAVGGLGLPRTIANAALLWLQAANVSIANYLLLTSSAAELLAVHGSIEQKRRYMQPMLEGRFLGTMALSEPQAGSSLGDITTRARLRADGRYALSGSKMWISGGEHDLAETIVHLMLARVEGAPAGVKGISLFIVPRDRLDAEGRPCGANHIAVAGLNHKMGQRGTVNCALEIGDGGETIGEIVGAPGQGLAQMFTMMNEARIGVSLGAVAHASAGFLHALAYARDRRQGRHPDQKDPDAPPVAIIEHADVRRMLLDQKAAAEGGIALGLDLAMLADLKAAAETAAERADAGLLLELLTPVFKAWISDEMLAASSSSMQVLGGAGYTRDHPLEQHYRDNRLNPIHEGTNGIQAIDLVGRKLGLGGGRALALLIERIGATISGARSHAALADAASGLAEATRMLAETAARLREIGRTRGSAAMLAPAHHLLDLVGEVVFVWTWLRQAEVAARALPAAEGPDRDFYAGKIAVLGHVARHRLPRIAHLGRLALDPGSYLDLSSDCFD